MIAKFLSLFTRKVRRIAFLDGDQALPGILAVHHKYLLGIETHLVRLTHATHAEPKCLRNVTGINKIYLSGYSTSKEVTDKFIGAYIQKAVQDGYTEVTVVSSDYDFIDIFKMAVVLNPSATSIKFRMIVPAAQGKLADLPEKVANIEVIREQFAK